MFAQKASEPGGRGAPGYADGEYFGGFSNLYVVGIDGGATYLNNYIAGTIDYVGRIAGMLLINGKMERARAVAGLVPVYLVNAADHVVDKYKKADGVNAYEAANGVEAYYDQAIPFRRVVVARDQDASAAKYIKDAYYSLFVKAQRVGVLKAGLNSD